MTWHSRHITKADEILDWRFRGYGVREIAKLVGVSLHYVKRVIRTYVRKTKHW